MENHLVVWDLVVLFVDERIKVLKYITEWTNPILILGLEVLSMPKSNLLKVYWGIEILGPVFHHNQIDVVCPGQAVLNKKVNHVHQ